MMVLKDGGVLIIPDKTINKWVKMYPNTDVKQEIYLLNKTRAFSILSKKGALKLINQTLKEKSNA